MFIKSHSIYRIKNLLLLVRLSIDLQNVRKITVDTSSTEYRAVQAVYPQATVQWCIFQSARGCMSNIRVLIELGIAANNSRVLKSYFSCQSTRFETR